MKNICLMLPDDTPVFRELAYPEGLEVVVGPGPGFCGRVEWTDTPLAGDRFTRPSSVLADYPDTVPVRERGVMGRMVYANKRWVAPLRATKEGGR